MEKKDYRNMALLLVIPILVWIWIGINGNLYGSVTDWNSQHTVLPEYFRTLFYQTGDFFPDFAFHLGAGQNIYNFSYYGLLSPIVLVSYLFPFVKMVDYMIIVHLVIVMISAILCYIWLRKNQFRSSICMVCSIAFTCAAPLIFQSHRHVMFMNYMPFLLMGLIGIDRYFEKHKSGLYIMGTFLMIMTSYYYSIGGILVFVFYGIYQYLQRNTSITVKRFLCDGMRFVIPICIAVLMSAILLLPSLYIILNGRSGGHEPIPLSALLFPKLDMNALLYSSYSIGLVGISFLAILHGFFTKKKEHIFSSIVILMVMSIPVIMYVLNGFLYIRSKVLIPFLPWIIFILAIYLQHLVEGKVSIRKEFHLLIFVSLLLLMTGYHQVLFYVDVIVCSILLFTYHVKRKPMIIFVPLVLESIILLGVVNTNERYVKKEDYQNQFSAEKQKDIVDVLQKDDSVYRMNQLKDTLVTANKIYDDRYLSTSMYSSTYNPYYMDLYYKTFGNAFTYRNRLVISQSNHILFETYMGVKYLLTDLGKEPAGYQLVKANSDYGIYQNNTVFPLGYASTKTMRQKEFDLLRYPYNVEALLRYVVVENGEAVAEESYIHPYKLEYEVTNHDLKVEKKADEIVVTADKTTEFLLNLKETLEPGKILMIEFDLLESAKCSSGDLSIAIGEISNKLTCQQWMYHNGNSKFQYVISSNEPMDQLNIKFSNGKFRIANIQHYILDYQDIVHLHTQLDPFLFDRNETNGDVIVGDIDVKKDGYFVFHIPYDEGFTILVDGKKQEYEKVDTAFIGFPIASGSHHITLYYHAPLKKAGLVGSIFGFLLFGIILWVEKGKRFS